RQRRAATADDRRHQSERRAGYGQDLALPEESRDGAEHDGEDDAPLNQRPNDRHRIKRARVRQRKQSGEMQAQRAAEAEEPEKDRRRAAAPAGSEVATLRITELFFEECVGHLRSPGHARLSSRLVQNPTDCREPSRQIWYRHNDFGTSGSRMRYGSAGPADCVPAGVIDRSASWRMV